MGCLCCVGAQPGRQPLPRPAHARHIASPSFQPALTRMFPICAGEDFILSQRSGVEEELFKGDILGVDADVRNGHDMEAGWKQAGPAGQGRNGHWLRWACEHGGYPHITLPSCSPLLCPPCPLLALSLQSTAPHPLFSRCRPAGGISRLPPVPPTLAVQPACRPGGAPPLPGASGCALCSQPAGGSGRTARPSPANPWHLGAQGGIAWLPTDLATFRYAITICCSLPLAPLGGRTVEGRVPLILGIWGP